MYGLESCSRPVGTGKCAGKPLEVNVNTELQEGKIQEKAAAPCTKFGIFEQENRKIYVKNPRNIYQKVVFTANSSLQSQRQ